MYGAGLGYRAAVSAASLAAVLGPVTISWSTVWTQAFSDTVGAGSGRTYVMLYAPAIPVPPLSRVRLRLVTNVSNPMTIGKLFIGRVSQTRSGFVFQEAPTQVTFDGGSPSVVLPASTTKLSDEVTYNYPGGGQLGFAMFPTAHAGSWRRVLSQVVWVGGDSAGDTASDPAVGTLVKTNSGMQMLGTIDVIPSFVIPENRIRISRQTLHSIKEGANPAPAAIKISTQNLYAVKG